MANNLSEETNVCFESPEEEISYLRKKYSSLIGGTTYVSGVDSQVEKRLEAVKPQKTRGKSKSSQTSQLADLKEGRLDLNSPHSILCQTNLRALLNRETFLSLPLYYQYKLVQLLPKFDQVLTPDGWIKPSSSALSNEFFAKSCQSWLERLSDSRLTVESIQRRKTDVDKEKAKLDPFKVKYFEPIWGQTLESQRDVSTEFERIPKSKPSSNSSQSESVRKNNFYSIKKFRSHKHRKVKPILKKFRIPETTDRSDHTNNSLELVSNDIETNVQTVISESQTIVDISIDSHIETKDSTPLEDSCIVKKARIESESESMAPNNDVIIQNVVLPSSATSSTTETTNTTTTSIKTTDKSEISAKDCENDSNRTQRMSRKRNCSTNVNKEGVDEERSFLICRRALKSSPNNKFFYVSRHRRIHKVVGNPSITATDMENTNKCENKFKKVKPVLKRFRITDTTERSDNNSEELVSNNNNNNNDCEVSVRTDITDNQTLDNSSETKNRSEESCAALKKADNKIKVIKVQLPQNMPQNMPPAVSAPPPESPKPLTDSKSVSPNANSSSPSNSVMTSVTKVIPMNTEALQKLKVVVSTNATQDMNSLTIMPSTSVIVSSSQLMSASGTASTPRIIAPKMSSIQQTFETPFSREVAVITAPPRQSHPKADHLIPERKSPPQSTQSILRLPCKLPAGLTIVPINEVSVITRSNSTLSPQTSVGGQPSPKHSSVWILPVSSATETNSVVSDSVSNQSMSQMLGMSIAMNNNNSTIIQTTNTARNNIVNLCGDTRLPSQITVIPLQSSGKSESTHGPCNLKPLIVCKKCGAYTHDECIGPSKLCVQCLYVR